LHCLVGQVHHPANARGQAIYHLLLEILLFQLVPQHLACAAVPGLAAIVLNGGTEIFNAAPQRAPAEGATAHIAGADILPVSHERARAVSRGQRRKVDVFHSTK
ncbi:hypothetical protein EY05_14770, partial [Staphylococcus aureus]